MNDIFDEADAPTTANTRLGANHLAVDELRQFIERYENLEAEKAAIVDGQREVKAEAKGRGYDMKAFGEILKLRKLDADERNEREALRTLYAEALGIFG